MAKFKISLELTGLKLNIEGEREDIPLLTKAVAAQIAGQIMPASGLADGRGSTFPGRETIDSTASVIDQPTGKPRSRKSSARAGNGAAPEAAVIVWQHDPNKWGSPLQDWKASDKALWLLYVAKQVEAATEMTSYQMVKTFEKLFRTAGKLNRGNIGRDFGKIAGEPKAKVATNGTVDPATWYLTDSGLKYAEELVKAARGEAPSQQS